MKIIWRDNRAEEIAISLVRAVVDGVLPASILRNPAEFLAWGDDPTDSRVMSHAVELLQEMQQPGWSCDWGPHPSMQATQA